MNEKRDVWITGIGLLSSHGEGTDAHWEALKAGRPANIDSDSFKPYPVHRLAEPDWATQISRRDMRQMEGWQRIGTYAAGLALDDAGVKNDEALCDRMDMIVAAGGGERDMDVDTAIMQEARGAKDVDALLNERLSNDLRPTLFLAQLSNLLAGNISIVHKITGSSRTFMGEEGAGISSIATAHARIANGQSDLMLVGGAYNGEREDLLLLFELGHFLFRGDWKPVRERAQADGGFTLASLGVFLVLEDADHAKARGAKPYAKLDSVSAAHGRRDDDALTKRLDGLFSGVAADGASAVLSGATGCAQPTAVELAQLKQHLPETPVRAFGNVFGHGVEAQFPLGVALAALCARHGEIPPPSEAQEAEGKSGVERIAVTTVGHNRAEGLALVSPVAD